MVLSLTLTTISNVKQCNRSLLNLYKLQTFYYSMQLKFRIKRNCAEQEGV